jgi:hypothetical protein
MVDALDESRPRENILKLLRNLIHDNRFRNIQLFATSRLYAEIERTMSAIAEPLSLSNPWVESDIKRFVWITISEDINFRRWPIDLRMEVEELLSKGAKGMFRWAVCQLDILRRLKTIKKIKEAIVSLPETLDETYERIFSCIHQDDRELVRHALRWICFHNALNSLIPLKPSMLVDTYLMCAGDLQSESSVLVDVELLKDSCGCLLTFQPGQESESIDLAHYTVREFLESSRTIEHSVFFRLDPVDKYRDILGSIFRHALASHPRKSREVPVNLSSLDLDDYCFASAMRALKTSEDYVEPSLAFQLLDPTSPRYPTLQLGELAEAVCKDQSCDPWELDWTSFDAGMPVTAGFIQLMELGCLRFADVYLRMHGIKKVLESEFSVSLDRPVALREGKYKFSGTVLEYMAVYSHYMFFAPHAFFFFCVEMGEGHANFASILPAYCGTHDTCPCYKGEPCILEILLELGALPDPGGYPVTPLQIACFLGDGRGAQLLLEAGADPNRTGDKDGVRWDKNSALHLFTPLHSLSPLRIITMSDNKSLAGSIDQDGMERLVLFYGGRDFDSSSS